MSSSDAGTDDAGTGDADYSGTRTVSVERVVAASAERVFDVLADPAQHPLIDGSGTVVEAAGEQRRLGLGATFGMKMRFKLPYRTRNRVLEFDENRLIAWGHFGRHRWRYELEPVIGGAGSDGGAAVSTLVRETFDWSTSRLPWAIELVGFPKRNAAAMRKTLERLAGLVEQGDAGQGDAGQGDTGQGDTGQDAADPPAVA